jgi:hypothetical protein
MIRSLLECASFRLRQKPPSLCLSPQGERVRQFSAQRMQQRPFSPSAPARGCGNKYGKLAKASLRGEGQDEGGLRKHQPELA